MNIKRTIIAAHKAKDAALYCTHVVPVAICWEHNPGEDMDIPTVLGNLLPKHIQSNRQLVHQLTGCIETAVDSMVEIRGMRHVVEDLKGKVRALSRSLANLTRGNEHAYGFFGKNTYEKGGLERIK